MTFEQWTVYYLEHPTDLLIFIKTANEEYNKVKAENIELLAACEMAVADLSLLGAGDGDAAATLRSAIVKAKGSN